MSVRIRLMGLPHEVRDVVEAVSTVLDVIDISPPYPCRGSRNVRVYLQVHTPRDAQAGKQ